VAHQGLRWFVRLRMTLAVGFVLGFMVYEFKRSYKTDLVGLPRVIWQDVVDWKDDAIMGKSYLEKSAEELQAQADGGNVFAMYVYALRRTTRPPPEVRISPADPKVAQEYYEKAAQKGFARAQAVMALYLHRNLAGTADLVKAKVSRNRPQPKKTLWACACWRIFCWRKRRTRLAGILPSNLGAVFCSLRPLTAVTAGRCGSSAT